MSRLYEEKFYTRWSDPVLRKHCTFCWPPTSEEDISSIHRSRSSSPLLSVRRQYVPAKESLSRYCLYRNKCGRRKSSKTHGTRNNKEVNCLNCQEPQKMRESLELHLTGTQVEESLAEDKQLVLVQHLDLTTVVLEALAQYSQSLQVSQLAAHRLVNVSHLLALPQSSSASYCNPDSTQLITCLQQLDIQKEKRVAALRDLIEHCSRHITLPKQLHTIMDDHCLRRRDFFVAAENFQNLLENTKLSISQMKKLHRQYGAILNDYQQSRRILNLELPKMINTRLMILQQAFEKIREFYNDQDSVHETLSLFKLIGERLCQDTLNSDTKIQDSHDPTSPKLGLCRRCYANHIDTK